MTEMRPVIARYAVIWLIVVSATAAVSWLAIARAGAEASLLGAPPPLAATSSTAAASSSPTAVIAATASPSATAAPAPTATPTSSTPTPGPVTRPSTSSSSSSTTSRPVRPVVRSYTTAGGQIFAYCEGGIPLSRVVPAEGWGFRISPEGGKLEVTFEPSAEDVDHIEVKVRCVGGLPTFSTD